ncbi:hypothetical protein RFI_20475 [Reticulomyxa filosa]|uniref:Uncharacterized protein n=1 Tax=Reticulomyxa filosa TaxID=46433 RepID=X6MST1_RETFI|nr:hypothetical protein RFI_20475 [Reticulomyxa filosa]|eukprot:ETO16864.1 hypothetical protein RFI_20475 [Reticulomyxa filosa]
MSLPYWEVLSESVRETINKAYDLKEAMENKEQELIGERQLVFDLQKSIEEKNNSILILKQQLEKREHHVLDLSTSQINYFIFVYVYILSHPRHLLNTKKKKKNMYTSMEKIQTQNEALQLEIGYLSMQIQNFAQYQTIVSPSVQVSWEEIPYIRLLHRTIYALRRRLNVLRTNREIQCLNLNLKPLPKRLIARDVELKHIATMMDEFDTSQLPHESIVGGMGMENGHLQMFRNVLSTDPTSSIVGNVAFDEKCLSDGSFSITSSCELGYTDSIDPDLFQKLQQLNSKVEHLRANPRVIDITSHTITTQIHEIVGRRIELRQLQLCCEQINTKIEQAKESSRTFEEEKASNSSGSVFGEIKLPRYDHNRNLPQNLSVIVPMYDLTKLQHIFGI